MTENPKSSSKVPHRMAWLERRLERLEKAGVPVPKEPMGSGPENRHGMPRIPIGQTEVSKWPVLDLGHQPEIGPQDWILEIGGLVENSLSLDWDALRALPQFDEEADFHCVTSWSLMDSSWQGARFADVAALAKPLPEAAFVVCTGSDHDPASGEAYTTNLPIDEALSEDVLLVHSWNGVPLPREHGGPVRVITPRLYAWKGAKWICRVEFTAEDRPGFWEKRGYSNSGDPWSNDRFSRL